MGCVKCSFSFCLLLSCFASMEQRECLFHETLQIVFLQRSFSLTTIVDNDFTPIFKTYMVKRYEIYDNIRAIYSNKNETYFQQLLLWNIDPVIIIVVRFFYSSSNTVAVSKDFPSVANNILPKYRNLNPKQNQVEMLMNTESRRKAQT